MINIHVAPLAFLSIVIRTNAMEKLKLFYNYYIFILIANFNVDIDSNRKNSK